MSNIPEFQLKKIKSEFPKEQLQSAYSIQKFVRKFYADDIGIYESFFILLFDRSMHTIGFAKISQGGCVGTVVDSRIIYQYAALSMASAVVLLHNHPSGSLTPSTHDIKITKQLKRGLKAICQCRVLDHIILTEEHYISFTEQNIKF